MQIDFDRITAVLPQGRISYAIKDFALVCDCKDADTAAWLCSEFDAIATAIAQTDINTVTVLVDGREYNQSPARVTGTRKGGRRSRSR